MPKLDRRTFQLSFVYGLWTVIGAALAAPAAIYLLTPPKSRKEGEWTEAGEIAKLPVGAPEEVVFRRNRVDGWKVISEKNTAWVIRKNDKEVVALAPQCTHLGCAYHWDANRTEFICPCHTSSFSMEGKVLTGPAPRPLDRYDVKVENGRLLLGRVVRSDSEEVA